MCVELTFCGIIESHVLKLTAKGSPLHLSLFFTRKKLLDQASEESLQGDEEERDGKYFSGFF